MSAAIAVEGVVKSYGDVRAVDGISFTVEAGRLVALLGPNGAGKTTTLEMLEGFQRPDRGQVRVLGVEPWRAGPHWRARIGVVLQSCGFDPYLTVREALLQRARWYAQPRVVDDVLAAMGLTEIASRRVQLLSGGQQRRLDVALALTGDPSVVFLDEPSTGLDVTARRRMWDAIRTLLDEGRTVLLTTHYLDEAAALADRMIVLARGRVAADGTPDELVATHGGVPTVTFRVPASVDIGCLPVPVQVRRSTTAGAEVAVVAEQLTTTLGALTAWALQRGIELSHLAIDRPSLEDAYRALTEQDSSCDSCV